MPQSVPSVSVRALIVRAAMKTQIICVIYCVAARALTPGACDQKTDRQARTAKGRIQ